MVKADRLLALLQPMGFQRTADKLYSGSLCYVRKSPTPDLYEQITIGSMGKKGEWAYARAVISVLYGPDGFEGLAFDEILLELASNKESGAFEFKNRSDVAEWEQRLATIAPQRTRQLAASHGAELLAASEGLRKLAEQYVSSLRQMNPEQCPDFLEFQLSRMASAEQLRHATRLAESASWPGDSLYMAAALTLVLFSELLEGPEPSVGKMPEFDAAAGRDRELRKLLSILVDRIQSRPNNV